MSLNDQSFSMKIPEGQIEIEKKEITLPNEPAAQQVEVNINIKTDDKEKYAKGLGPFKETDEPLSPKI